MMNWTYNGTAFDPLLIGKNKGFIYIIHNRTNGRKYIGQKLFKFKRNKPSGWEKYTGSNVELNLDIVNGHDIEKEIIYLVETKGMMNYIELKAQILRGVLESNDWYNGFIGGKIHKRHIRK